MTDCKKEARKTEKHLKKSCGSKVNSLAPCDEKEAACSCSSPGAIDLVILVDSSGSMGPVHSAINQATQHFEKVIHKRCGSKAKITKLSLDNSVDFSGGGYDASNAGDNIPGFLNHEKFLKTDNRGAPFSGALYIDDGEYDSEQGAKGIADIAAHFNWEPGHCRSILYISDEWLDNKSQGGTAAITAIPIAVNAANTHSVTVFTHLVDSGSGSQSNPGIHPLLSSHYTQLAESTGGRAHIGDAPSRPLYQDLVATAACECQEGCTELEIPEIKPCVSISWGDSDCDGMETDDFEVLCITVSNCYSNIAFDNFTIHRIEVTDSNGKLVAKLPDGTRSVQAVPIGPVCFGTIAPCKDGETEQVSREFAIKTRGAMSGDYLIKLHGMCFQVRLDVAHESCFKLKLCKS